MVGDKLILPDHATIAELRAEFRGNYEGLSKLEQLLDSREAELVELTEHKDKE